MPYAPVRSRRRDLHSPADLEDAMRERNLSSRELAEMVNTGGQTISQLRLGLRTSVSVEIAEKIERALKVGRGNLFGPAYDASIPTAREAATVTRSERSTA